MKPAERVQTALRGRTPDRVPVVPIYDWGYVIKLSGADPRKAITATPSERAEHMENAFVRHKVDGCFVHSGAPANRYWKKRLHVEEMGEYWMMTDEDTGERFRTPAGLDLVYLRPGSGSRRLSSVAPGTRLTRSWCWQIWRERRRSSLRPPWEGAGLTTHVRSI